MSELSGMTRYLCLFTGLLLLGLLPACVPSTPAAQEHEVRQRRMFGLLEKFDRYDYNGDGYMSRSELNELIKVQKIPDFTPAKLDKVMRAYDTNNDQRISLHEADKGANLGPQIFEQP